MASVSDPGSAVSPEQDPAGLEQLLEFLRDARGFDFTGYKRPTLQRRIVKRMDALGVTRYDDYREQLELRPEEFAALFATILINVTSFYRDPTAWGVLREHVAEQLLPALAPGQPIRAWSAACASGEEAYTLVMLLCDLLGDDEVLARVKVYATDVDEDALATARSAVYPASALKGLPEGYAARFFDRIDEHHAVRGDLRRVVVFGRNDLVQDAPISRVDLLTCRNTLMYFNAETQGRMLQRLHFSLTDHGLLLLGKSEMLTAHAGLFKPVDLKCRLFRKVPRAGRRGLSAFPSTGPGGDGSVSAVDLLRADAFELSPLPQAIVDTDGVLVAANAQARGTLRIAPVDVGRPLAELEVSYRPAELGGPVARALVEGRSARLPAAAVVTPAGERCEIEVELTPMTSTAEPFAVALAFHDVTEQRRLHDDVEAARIELETAYEELQSTVEELETTNEELQSTNEELETTNEELQSSNEELETMNEELHSTNEEIATVNEELHHRTVRLDDVNGFLETILSTLGVAVAVVDRTQAVQLWNQQSEDMWGLRADEVTGSNLFGLDLGLPLQELVVPIRETLRGDRHTTELVLGARTRRGRDIGCRVTVLPLHTGEEVSGAVLMMVDAELSPGQDAHDARP